jgi:hypothetical protein
MATKPPKDTPVWVTVLKLVVLALCLIGGVGLALWWAAGTQDAPTTLQTKPGDWGIAKDSPFPARR